MSDLANSCEYLTIEKTCAAIAESEKAKANRQTRCQNEEKLTCCYVCISRRECAICCRFLGNIGNEPSHVEAAKTEPVNTIEIDKKPEAPQTENAPTTYCSSCKIEMAQNRTQLKISDWKGPTKISGEFLPVIVYVCPQCGKIEFRADETV